MKKIKESVKVKELPSERIQRKMAEFEIQQLTRKTQKTKEKHHGKL